MLKTFKAISLTVVVAALLTLGFIGGPNPAQAAGGKLAVVDIAKCIQLTEDGKATYRELKGERDKLESELKAKEKEIEGIRSKLEKGVGVLSETARVTLEGDLRRKSRSYRDLLEDSQARLRQMEGQRTRPIVNRLVAVIKEIGKRDGYDMIIDVRSNIYYANPDIELTNKVITEYNKKHPVAEGKKK